MVLSKSPLFSLSLLFIFIVIPFTVAFSKQKLDQPPILSSNNLKQVTSINHYLPDYIAVDDQNRIFAEFPNYNQDSGPSLAIINPDHSITPYPGGSWNQWNQQRSTHQTSLDPSHSFIGLSGMTLTDEGVLWVLDSGVEKTGQPAIRNGVKLVKIDTKSNRVVQTYPIPASVILQKSVLNTLAVHDHFAYFADKNVPALIVMDLDTGKAKRLLENSASLYARRDIVINHHLLHSSSDQNSFFNINQLAITPDGKRIYYQAVSGPLYRIDTTYLNDPTYSESELNEAMILWFDTPTSGGITCDTDGTLYFTDLSTNSIYRFTTERILSKLITDPRLQWPAHPFVTKGKTLYIPVTQFNHYALLNHNSTTIKWPLSIYKLSLPPLK